MPQASNAQKKQDVEVLTNTYSTKALQKAEKYNHDAEIELRHKLRQIYENHKIHQKQTSNDLKYVQTSLTSIKINTGHSSRGLPPILPRDKSIIRPIFVGKISSTIRKDVLSTRKLPKLRRSSDQHLNWELSEFRDINYKCSLLGPLSSKNHKVADDHELLDNRTFQRKPKKKYKHIPKTLSPLKISNVYQARMDPDYHGNRVKLSNQYADYFVKMKQKVIQNEISASLNRGGYL